MRPTYVVIPAHAQWDTGPGLLSLARGPLPQRPIPGNPSTSCSFGDRAVVHLSAGLTEM